MPWKQFEADRFFLQGALRARATGMTVGAIHLRQITDVYRMLELSWFGGDQFDRAFLLAQDGMAGVAILGHNFAIRAHVLAVVAAEATHEIEVPEIIRMGLPIHLHFGKRCAPENCLHFPNRILNVCLLASGQSGILARVKIIQ